MCCLGVEYVNLWPFSQGEIQGIRERFIDPLLNGTFPKVSDAPVGRRAVATQLVTGGYPEMQGRSPRGRGRFFASYLASILDRDVPDIANIRSIEVVGQLLHVVAARSAALASFHGMSGANERRITADGAIAGMMLESFVAMESSLRQSDWGTSRCRSITTAIRSNARSTL